MRHVSRKANDQGRFGKVKTRLTTEEGRKVQEKERLYTYYQRLVARRQDRLD